MGPPGWAGMFGFGVDPLREKDRRRICKGKTWRVPDLSRREVRATVILASFLIVGF